MNLKQKFLAKLPKHTQLALWMVVFPLALMVFSFWEYTQFSHTPFAPFLSANDAQKNQPRIQELQGVLTRIQDDRYATIQVDGKRYGNPLASQMLRAEIARLQGVREEGPADDVAVSSVVLPAALTAMLVSGAAAVMGWLGLLAVELAAHRARRSRDDLMRVFAAWRARLPFYLGSVLVLQVVAIGALAVVRAYVAYADKHASRADMKLHLLLLGLALVFMWSGLLTLWRLRGTLKVLEADPGTILGRTVTPQEAPALWHYVSEMARRAGAAVPVNIVVGIAESFYVTAHDMVVQPAGQRLSGETMYLPLTYLTMLRRDEIDAIVLHELGHFAGDDTRYSLGFAPLYRGMVRSLAEVEAGSDNPWGSMPAISFTAYLLQRFDHAVKYWSRIREFAADQASARVVGPEVTARALVHVTALDTAVNEVMAEVARRPDEAGHDLVEMLSQALQVHGLQPPDFAQEVSTAHPSDTHPPTLERLQALGQPLSTPLLQAALAPVDGTGLVWARSLFLDSQALQSTLLADFKASAREHNEERRQQLTALASESDKSVEIHEKHGWLTIGLCGFFSLACAVVGVTVMRSEWPWMLVTLATAAALAAWAGVTWRRSKTSLVMELTPSVLRVHGVQEELSWGDVSDYNIMTHHHAITIRFALAPSAPALTRLHSNHFRVSCDKRHLVVKLNGARGMKNDAFFELLHSYLTGWHAREQLRAM